MTDANLLDRIAESAEIEQARIAAAKMADLREQVTDLLGCDPEDVAEFEGETTSSSGQPYLLFGDYGFTREDGGVIVPLRRCPKCGKMIAGGISWGSQPARSVKAFFADRGEPCLRCSVKATTCQICHKPVNPDGGYARNWDDDGNLVVWHTICLDARPVGWLRRLWPW